MTVGCAKASLKATVSAHLGVPSQLCLPRSLGPQQILQRLQMPAWEGAWLRAKAQGQMEVRVVVPGLGNTLPPPQPRWAERGTNDLEQHRGTHALSVQPS